MKSIPVLYKMTALEYLQSDQYLSPELVRDFEADKVILKICQHHNTTKERAYPNDFYTDIARIKCTACGWQVLEN